MSNVVNFEYYKVRKSSNQLCDSPKSSLTNTFQSEVDKDAEKLAEKLDISVEEAIKIAEEFYWSYPMLVEWVRSVEYRFRNRE